MLERGHDILQEFEAAYAFAGPTFTRQIMNVCLRMLEQVYHEKDIGRELAEDEQLERYTAWNVGLEGATLDAF